MSGHYLQEGRLPIIAYDIIRTADARIKISPLWPCLSEINPNIGEHKAIIVLGTA